MKKRKQKHTNQRPDDSLGSAGTALPKSPLLVSERGEPDPIIISPKARHKMRRHIWNQVQIRIGIGLFMDILASACDAMLGDSAEPSVTTVKISDFFDADGFLSSTGEAYLSDAYYGVVNEHFGYWSDDGTTFEELALLLTKEVFDYFASEAATANKAEAKKQANQASTPTPSSQAPRSS